MPNDESSEPFGLYRARPKSPVTPSWFPEVHVLLTERVDASGRRWVRLRIPMRPNARVGWVRRESLDAFHLVRTRLVIDRRALRAVLYRRGKRAWQAPVGIGAPGARTPAGRFWVREKFRVDPRASGVYGTHAFGTSAYSTLSDWPGGGVVGLHGTGRPGLIPGRPSHGCVRIRNPDIGRLFRLMPVGTPIRVL